MYFNDPKCATEISEFTFEQVQKKQNHRKETLEILHKLDVSLLSSKAKIDFILLNRTLQNELKLNEYPQHILFQVNQMQGLHLDWFTLVESTKFDCKQDFM